MNALIQQALAYRDMGLCPMPLYRKDDPKQTSGNKQPIIPGWEKLTMPDESTIAQWWPDGVKRNIGIVCGRVSGNLIVADFDDMEAWRIWAMNVRPPQTYVVLTGKGIHCYYRTVVPAVGNKRMTCGDVRGQGGQVVAPPSVHLSGKVYEVGADIPIVTVNSIDDLQLPFPIVAKDAVQDRRDAERALNRAQKDAAVGGVLRRLTGERNQGNRNNLLYWSAHRLKEANVAPLEIQNTLGQIARAIGLEEVEITKTLGSALNWGNKS